MNANTTKIARKSLRVDDMAPIATLEALVTRPETLCMVC
jgi:hypothetical protein